MSGTVFLAVIAAALFHATWNALVKGGADKTLSMAGVVIGHVPLAGLVLLIAPAPDWQCMPYLLVGTALHFGYQTFLLKSYEAGDLTQVYPIARGSAPLIVALVSVLALGVHLEGLEILAIVVIGLGIISLALVRQQDGLQNRRAALLALVTGLFIASYSLVDGLGARASGSSWAFYGWLALGNALIMSIYLAVRAPQVLRDLPTKGLRVLLIGGAASYLAYGSVTWAFTQAPIALVTALRETSIIFALLIGVVFLKERLSLLKVASTFCTLAGAILLRFGRS